jgi:signal transduction histidine kinase
MPLYFFEIKNRKLIFWGMALSIIPYALYHYATPFLGNYALTLNEQLNVYKTTVPMKILTLSILLYLIYNKNADYEKEVQEKEMQIIGQKKLYECILEQIPIDIVTFDKELKYTYINSTAIRDAELRKWMLGKTNLDYFEHRNLDARTAGERDKVLHEALQQKTPVTLEETLVDRHGALKHSLKGAAPIYSENKELLCLIGYSLDITDIKEAERKLKEYSAELERKNDDLHHFINATSHDLKTPLRNIASYLQLLEKKNGNKLDEDSLSLISYTVKSVKHLNQLIGDIYQYSVADRNDKPAEETDLNKILEDILLQMEDVIAEKNAAIQFSGLPVLKVSPSHFGMVFSNVLNNGIKYNNAVNPQVVLRCETREEDYLFSIKDNGIGIQKEYQKKVFEIFQRLHTPAEYEGTGVGLAICNKIVENYGGKMWVESELGIGSTFYFTLPKEIVNPEANHRIKAYKDLAIAG